MLGAADLPVEIIGPQAVCGLIMVNRP